MPEQSPQREPLLQAGTILRHRASHDRKQQYQIHNVELRNGFMGNPLFAYDLSFTE